MTGSTSYSAKIEVHFSGTNLLHWYYFFLQSNVRDLLQISLLVLSEFEQINELLFPLKPMVF